MAENSISGRPKSKKEIWILICIMNLTIAAVMGLLLRWVHIQEIPWLNFKKMMHGHSHVALLGWAYLAIYYIFYNKILSEVWREKAIVNWVYWITQLSVIGMAISFPVQGYGKWSIFFSTLHVFCSYAFFIIAWLGMSKTTDFQTRLLLKTALSFLLLSTLGLWYLAYIMVNDPQNTMHYYVSLQFFLHFQFYGWLQYAVMGLIFKSLRENEVRLTDSKFFYFYVTGFIATLATFSLVLIWAGVNSYNQLFMTIGVAFNLISISIFLHHIYHHWNSISHNLNVFVKALWCVALGSMALKSLILLSTMIPAVSEISYQIRQFVVGFIHLQLFGFISFFLMAFLFSNAKSFDYIKTLNWGIYLLISGFVVTEILLFVQGYMLWMAYGFMPAYYELIFAFSISKFLGAFLLFLALAIQIINSYQAKLSIHL
ncbi:MAG: hypothetical protein JJU28_24425 [Cyclobacteriaceae bacterium]|nr:hypothetical protein [Cyclobacteriaceae bacterium]